jgi:hypothetical protein
VQQQLGVDRCHASLGKLFSWGYEYAPVTIGSITQMLKESDWKGGSPGAAPLIEHVIKFAALTPANLRVTSLLIHAIWSRCQKKRMAELLIAKLLEGIGRSVAGRFIAKPIYRRSISLPGNSKSGSHRRLIRFLRRWRS